MYGIFRRLCEFPRLLCLKSDLVLRSIDSSNRPLNSSTGPLNQPTDRPVGTLHRPADWFSRPTDRPTGTLDRPADLSRPADRPADLSRPADRRTDRPTESQVDQRVVHVAVWLLRRRGNTRLYRLGAIQK